MTQEEMYRDYQEFSRKAGERATWIAVMIIIMAVGSFHTGKVYEEFTKSAVLACCFLLLHTMQAVWQTVSMWIFRQTKASEDANDYPDWVGGPAWVLFYAKMVSIAASVFILIDGFFC